LLAQVLIAATFPDQIADAARFVRANGTSGIDDQQWDISVKSVAHYPSALNMMADRDDWMSTLGQAYATQSSDVMSAVQRMRRMADSQGNLQSNEQQQISRDDDQYIIAPAQPRVIYVPVYDPVVIYTRPVFRSAFYSRYWSFGIGFPIGSWLGYDFNWRNRSIYYHGWDRAYYGHGGGWRGRSYRHIHVTNIYVNNRYRNVYINRDIIRRRVEYRNVDRYVGVHRDTRFGRPNDSRGIDRRGDDRYRGETVRGSSDNGNRDRRDDERRGNGDRGTNDGNNRGGSDRQQSDGNNRGGDDRTPNDGSRGNSGRGQRDVIVSDREQRERNDVPLINPRRAERVETQREVPQYTPRNDERGREPRRAEPQPTPRNEQPMINPRRAERVETPREVRQEPRQQGENRGNDGARGRDRGGDRGAERGSDGARGGDRGNMGSNDRGARGNSRPARGGDVKF
jgi:Protein of unknown function (DUF3300)